MVGKAPSPQTISLPTLPVGAKTAGMKTLPFALFILTVCSVSAQDKITVGLETAGISTNEMYSYVARELRGLHDCEVRSNYVNYVVSIAADQLSDGHSSVYIASVVVSRPGLPGTAMQGIAHAPTAQALAANVVTQIDLAVFEPDRQERIAAAAIHDAVTNKLDLRPVEPDK